MYHRAVHHAGTSTVHATIRFGEYDAERGLSGRVIERPVSMADAESIFRAGKPLAMEFAVLDGPSSFGMHDPAKGWMTVQIYGHPLYPDNFSSLRYEVVEPGVMSLVAVHLMCDSFDPDHGDEFRWDQHVFLAPPERRRAILDLRSHRVWMVESLVGDERMAALAGRRFRLGSLSDYAVFACPDLVGEALRDLEGFNPDLPGVHAFNPDDDPHEACRLMDETWAFDRSEVR